MKVAPIAPLVWEKYNASAKRNNEIPKMILYIGCLLVKKSVRRRQYTMLMKQAKVFALSIKPPIFRPEALYPVGLNKKSIPAT